MLPHCQQPINLQEPGSNSDQGRESPAESTSSQETWPTANAIRANRIKEEREDDVAEQSVVCRASNLDKLSLQDVARGRVDVISERMRFIPDSCLEELKAQLRAILEGSGGSQQREEFLVLQKLVQSRSDLTSENLSRAHRAQLEILVSINTGIQAFLHPSIGLSQASLIEVFLYKRCRNIACQTLLPSDDCTCKMCSTRKGFCNSCMCVICNKFDVFEVNSCRWIGCDMCSHWTHTDCAIRGGHIFMGVSKAGLGSPEMLSRCRACNKTAELLGWVKDVFQDCVESWNAEALARELDYACRIFRGSEDLGGTKLFSKCKDLIEKLKTGYAESLASKAILIFLQGMMPMTAEEKLRELREKSFVVGASASVPTDGTLREVGHPTPPARAPGASRVADPAEASRKRSGKEFAESLYKKKKEKLLSKDRSDKIWETVGVLNNFVIPTLSGLADHRPDWVLGPSSEIAQLEKKLKETDREVSRLRRGMQEVQARCDRAVFEADQATRERDEAVRLLAQVSSYASGLRSQFEGHADRARCNRAVVEADQATRER